MFQSTPIPHTTIGTIMSPNYTTDFPFKSSSLTSPKPVHSALGEGSFFGVNIYTSPEHSDNGDADDSDGRSDSTLEDDYSVGLFGHPLARMTRIKSADYGFQYEQNTLFLSSHSCCCSLKQGSTESRTSYDAVDYDNILDDLLNLRPDPFEFPGHRNLIFPDPGKHSVLSSLPIMIKRLRRSSSELRLLLELNHSDLRDDPWNAAPHIIRSVEKVDNVYLCLQQLSEYNQPPLMSVAHYIDFFRQMLEGLAFLHERRIAGLSCGEPSSYMVDLSSASLTSATFSHDSGAGYIGPQQFDRVSYPVKYYLVNYTNASYICNGPTSSSPGSPTRDALDTCPFRKDVQDSATMIDGLLSDVPQISSKFKPLIKAMTHGGFTADDSRRLFEALCRTLDAPVFETAAHPASTIKQSDRAHTTPNPILEPVREHFIPIDRANSG